jgi:hypothetical protein
MPPIKGIIWAIFFMLKGSPVKRRTNQMSRKEIVKAPRLVRDNMSPLIIDVKAFCHRSRSVLRSDFAEATVW